MFHRVMPQYASTAPPTSNSTNKTPIPSQRLAPEALRFRVRVEDNAISKSLRSLSNEELRARVNNALQSDPNLLSIRINSVQLLASGDLGNNTEKVEDNEALTYNAKEWVKFLGE